MAKTFSEWIATLSAVTGLGAGDKIPVVEGGTSKYVEGDDLGGSNAATVTISDAAGDSTTWVLLGTAQTGNLSPATDAGLTYNATTNALTATTFVGNLTGNADTVTGFSGTSSGVNTGDQTLTNSSDATSHTVTLSASGGSIQFVEGSGVTLTTSGSASAGVVTIAASGGSSYLKYVALLSQSGTDAPVAAVLENTLGGTVVWSREDVGRYSATLTGAFTANKTWCSAIAGGYYGNSVFLLFTRIDSDTAMLQSYDYNGLGLQDISTDTEKEVSIEIRVYP